MSHVAFVNGSAKLSFVADGLLAVTSLNDRVAYHWIDKVKGINERQLGYNGDDGQPGGPTINGHDVSCCGRGIAYKY